MSYIPHQKRHIPRAPLLINRSELVRPAPGAWAGSPAAPRTIADRLLSLACLDQDHPQR
jgi:hypothetical protein